MKKSTGKQIKNFAGLLCVLGCAFSLLGGILFFASDQVFIGLCAILAGCYVSWACTRCLKGFGELVEDTAANLEVNEQILDVLESMYTRELEADAAKQSATPPSDEPVFVEKTYPRSTTKTVKKYNPLLKGLVISVIILFVLIIIGASTSSTATPSATAKPTKKVVVTAAPTKTPFISATPKRTKKATVKPTSTATPTATPTNTPAPTPEETAFVVEHDAEYYATQEYIHKFLQEKGYEVQTIVGVPNIGRYEDAVPTDAYVNWYAYINRNGKLQEFVIVLFNGEVSAIRPIK